MAKPDATGGAKDGYRERRRGYSSCPCLSQLATTYPQSAEQRGNARMGMGVLPWVEEYVRGWQGERHLQLPLTQPPLGTDGQT